MKFQDINESMNLSRNSLSGTDIDQVDLRNDVSRNSSISPFVTSKYQTSLRFYRSHQSNSNTSRNSSLNRQNLSLEDDDDPMTISDEEISYLPSTNRILTSTSSNSMICIENHQHSPLIDIDEMTFKIVIIGATYQHCFQDNYPVIAPPQTCDKHIIGVDFSSIDGSLAIKIHIPKDNSEKLISLGTKWTWIRANPQGYLVFKGNIYPNVQAIGYYLPKHPSDWKTSSSQNIPTISSMPIMDTSICSIGNDSNHSRNHFDRLIMNDDLHNCSMISTNSNSNNIITIDESDEIDDEDDNDLMMSISNDHETNENTSIINWNHPGIIALILPFLIDYRGYQSMSNQSSPSKSTAMAVKGKKGMKSRNLFNNSLTNSL
jgi:hypothetical protein